MTKTTSTACVVRTQSYVCTVGTIGLCTQYACCTSRFLHVVFCMSWWWVENDMTKTTSTACIVRTQPYVCTVGTIGLCTQYACCTRRFCHVVVVVLPSILTCQNRHIKKHYFSALHLEVFKTFDFSSHKCFFAHPGLCRTGRFWHRFLHVMVVVLPSILTCQNRHIKKNTTFSPTSGSIQNLRFQPT